MIVRPLSLGLFVALAAGPAVVLAAGPAVGQTAVAPDLVGRIAAVAGAVSFHFGGAAEWQVARRNLPVTTGMAVWVAPAAEAALDVSGSRIVVGAGTELDVDRLDTQALAATQPQGESYWHLRAAAAESYVVHTPRGTVTLGTVGRYAIVSGDTEHPTTITVLEGEATLTDGIAAPPAGPGQMLTVTGDGSSGIATATIGPVVQDGFLRHVLAEEAPPRPRGAAAPAIVAQMTGAGALEDVGRWTENAEYGPVWYPPAAEYVPYRQGNWAYVAPWGWTWVDDAPWGFAPSHYGRWARSDGRWGWVPGRDWAPGRVPAYAPALVGFIGGAALGAGLGHERLVGWAPLGPREAYRPPYQVERRTIDTLNQPTGATLPPRPASFDRGAVTIVASQVLTTSAPVGEALRAGAFRAGGGAAIGAAPVLQYRPQAFPTRATLGATRTVLQQVNPIGLAAPTSHIGAGPPLSRAVLEGPRPQNGLAAPLLGGAASGAVGGSLLRAPSRPEGLPSLRQRGDMPPGLPGAIARPRQPVRPTLLDTAPRERRGADLLGGRPPGLVPTGPRPGAIAAPFRPEPPRVSAPLPVVQAPVFRAPPVREQRPPAPVQAPRELRPAFRPPPPVFRTEPMRPPQAQNMPQPREEPSRRPRPER